MSNYLTINLVYLVLFYYTIYYLGFIISGFRMKKELQVPIIEHFDGLWFYITITLINVLIILLLWYCFIKKIYSGFIAIVIIKILYHSWGVFIEPFYTKPFILRSYIINVLNVLLLLFLIFNKVIKKHTYEFLK